jgi:hypothetical protein
MQSDERTVRLRAEMTREKLIARNPEGSAVRETLLLLSDEESIRMDDHQTATKIERLKVRNGKNN